MICDWNGDKAEEFGLMIEFENKPEFCVTARNPELWDSVLSQGRIKRLMRKSFLSTILFYIIISKKGIIIRDRQDIVLNKDWLNEIRELRSNCPSFCPTYTVAKPRVITVCLYDLSNPLRHIL